MAFASLTIDLNARLANIERDMGRAAQVAERQSQRMQASFAKAGHAFAAIGTAIGVGSFASFVKSSIDAADETAKLSQKLGISVEQLSGYKVAADLSGISIENFGTGVRQLSKHIAEQDPLLKKLGITATNADDAMAQLADVFAALPDGAQKTAIAMNLMGKAGADMIPLLNGGGAALQDMVEKGRQLNPITSEMAKQAEKFNDALTVFQAQAAGVGVSIATQLLPSMNALLERWNDAIRLSQQHGGFVSLILGGINPTGDNADNLRNVRREIEAINLQLKDADTPQGIIAGIDGPALRTRLANLQKLKASLLEIQRTQALALGAPYADYKIAKTPRADLPADLLKTGGAGKAAKDKLDTIDPFYAARTAAEKSAQAERIANSQAEFDALDSLRNDQIAQDERAAAALGRMRDAQISILDPIQQYRDKLDEVQQLQDAGLFTPEQAAAANLYWQEQIDAAAGFGEAMKKVASETDIFWENAIKGLQSSLADYLFDPFSDGVDGMLKGFGNVLKRMAAEAIAADITRSIFGSGGTGGSDQNLLGSVASLFGFANGGAFTVGGSGGTDSQLVAFKATPGEQVAIRTPAQQRNGGGSGAINIHFNVSTPDAASFRKSSGQIQADLARAVQGARRYS